MLEKHMWNTCLLYVVVEIWQLVNEISSFPEVLYKGCDLKNFSKFTDKQKKQWIGGFLTKDVLKNFSKFTDKHLRPSLLFNKAAGCKKGVFTKTSMVLQSQSFIDYSHYYYSKLFKNTYFVENLQTAASKTPTQGCLFLIRSQAWQPERI